MRLVSYNIRKAVGLDWARRPDRILDVLAELDGDVVLLQEADKRLGARPTALPRAMIEARTDYAVADVADNAVSLGWHGNAVLVRKGLHVTATRRIPLPGLEPRGAVMVSIEPDRGAGPPLHLVGTHLALLRRWRLAQIARLQASLPPSLRAHAVIGGDFNEWSDTDPARVWRPGFTEVSPGPSFHAARPRAALDRFAVGSAIRVTASGVATRGPARTASDHLPVWIEIAR